jgi:hypothetical protein
MSALVDLPAIVLLVGHLSANGTWIQAPPADMDTMYECQEAKRETEAGLIIDGVPKEDFEVECKDKNKMGEDNGSRLTHTHL